jgi:DNA polymerase elongation subunit (family B)
MSVIQKDPEIEKFLYGHNPQEGIVNIEYEYDTNYIFLILEDFTTGKLKMAREQLKPFLWTKDLKQANFYKGDKKMVRKKMAEYEITTELLETKDIPRNENGYKYLVKCNKTWNDLGRFFKEGGIDIRTDKEHIQHCAPIEQYLISTGKRLFKGFKDYNSVHRYIFDIETTGLDPKTNRIFMIGAKTTRGFEKLYAVEKPDDDEAELNMIVEWATELNELKPSIIAGHNSENFDFYFLIERLKILGSSLEEVLKTLYSKHNVKRRQSTIKLANEVEMYDQTLIWGINVIDTIHSVRRAQAINSEIKSSALKYICKFSEIAKPNRVYIPDGLNIWKIYNEDEDYWFNDKNGQYKSIKDNPELIDLDIKYPDVYKKVTGKYIVERYLMDDLWETMQVDAQFNQSAYLMGQILPLTYHRILTMGTATQWKLIMFAWSYENKLPIPELDKKRDFTGGLSRLLRVGFNNKIIKLDFASLYPSIVIAHDVIPNTDITSVIMKILKYFYLTRRECKSESQRYSELGDYELSSMFDRKQLPIKIINNSLYGAFTCPSVFPWCEMDKGEEITCRGRNYTRQMCEFFIKYKFNPITIDTDGVHFSYEDVDLNYNYTGKGLNWMVKKDKEYKGLEAYVSEFNDMYMRDVMGLDIDEIWENSINLARKNYAGYYYKKGKPKIKMVGNSIKSRNIPTYIEEFIDKTLNILLDPNVEKGEKGQNWLEFYYDTVEKIYNREIPLLKIAQKSKVKQSVDDYIKRAKSTNKNGGKLPKLTHMELIIENGKHVSLGDVIYFVNNGNKASQGDSGSHKLEDGTVVPNSYLIDTEELKNNPELKGEYNVPRAIDLLNKKIKLFLVVFDRSMRDQIMIKEPSERKLFTRKECELVSGQPIEDSDQDRYQEDLIDLEEKEKVFWKNYYEKLEGNIPTELYDIQDPSLPEFEKIISDES